MENPPPDLLAMLPQAARVAVENWWHGLDQRERDKLASLWDERLETSFFSPQRDDSGHFDDWEQVSSVSGGKFIPPDDAHGFDEWAEDHFEILLEHPEIVLAYQEPVKTFFIGGVTELPAKSPLPNS